MQIRQSLRLRHYPILLLIFILVGTLFFVIKLSITIYGEPESHHHILNNGGKTVFPISKSKNVIVRAAYFDDRPRNGLKNATVFMLQVRKQLLGLNSSLIMGCGVGQHVAAAGRYNIRPCGSVVFNSWIHKNYPDLTHDEIMLDCFDLPAQNGSPAFIIYKPNFHSSLARIAHSEHPFLIPAPLQPHYSHNYNFKILSCVKIFRTPIWLVEWLHYQKAIGIDHVHMTVQNLFLNIHEQSYLRQAVREGFVTVDEWHQWLNDSEIYYHSQTLALIQALSVYHGSSISAYYCQQKPRNPR